MASKVCNFEMTKQITIIVFFSLMYSCHGAKKPEVKEFDAERDCVRLHQLMSDAFEYAKKHDVFEKVYEHCILDSQDTYGAGEIYDATITLKSDYLFSPDQPYLLMYVNMSGSRYRKPWT